MNEKYLLKTLWSVIIILLLMNVGMMAWFWLSSNKTTSASPLPQARLYLEKEVNFNEQQTEVYRKLRQEHLQELHELRDSVRHLKEALFNQIPDTKITKNELEKLTKELGDKMAKIDEITFQHFQEVRKICQPNQLKKFDKVIGKVAEQANRPGPPPPRDENNQAPSDEQGSPHDNRPPPQ